MYGRVELKRIESWIETRIKGKMMRGESISTDDIVAEISGLMGLNHTEKNIQSLKKLVRRIRNRLYSRQKRRLEISRKIAKDIFVSPELVRRWIEIGLMDPKKIREIERWKKIILEREYFRQVMQGTVTAERIPMEKGSNLWD